MKPSYSLQKQLLLLLVLGMSAIFTAFWWLSQTAVHNLSEKYVLTRLDHDVELIKDHLVLTGDEWHLDKSSLGPIYMSLNSGHYFYIETAKQLISSVSLGEFKLARPEFPVDQKVLVAEVKGPVENSVLMFAKELEVNGRTIKIYVAENHDPIREVLFEFDLLFALMSFMALLSMVGLQRGSLKRVFHRLKPLEDKLEQFQVGYPLEINPNNYPLEVHSLIDSLNLALDASRRQFEFSRQKNSDLSHSLKTPLNIIFQLLNSDELKQFPNLQEDLHRQAQSILNKIEYELKTERSAQLQQLKNIDLYLITNELIVTMQQLHSQKNIEFTTQGLEQLLVRIEQEDAFEIIGNLLDNACKWTNDKIRVSFNAHSLVIEDNGNGVSDKDLEKLAHRGYRADEATPGHGIGLSIVMKLVELYQWQIHFAKSDLGGLKVTLGLKK